MSMSWVIYDFSYMFICFCGFVTDCQRGRLLGHMWIILGTYVIIVLANPLTKFILLVGRSRMYLIFQETCCSSQVLKLWELDQETSEEGLFIKAGQIPNNSRQIISIEV